MPVTSYTPGDRVRHVNSSRTGTVLSVINRPSGCELHIRPDPRHGWNQDLCWWSAFWVERIEP